MGYLTDECPEVLDYIVEVLLEGSVPTHLLLRADQINAIAASRGFKEWRAKCTQSKTESSGR